jgi:predicted dinucleotide-binding enzyme
MHIAIIGTGNIGRVLGRRWAEAGHTVLFGTRRPEEADLQTLARDAGAELKPLQEAASTADVIVLAVPGLAAEAVVRGLGELGGKILVDCTNPLGPDRTPEPGRSMAERIAEIAPGARVVKAFNTTGAKNMADPVYPTGPLAMPLCGDDANAKATVAGLAATLGFVPLDNGPLRQALALEAMAFVWISQAYGQGWGPDFGFAVLKR